jgi:uncharacterized protein YdhG (YjbR/CyaY superfamily)
VNANFETVDQYISSFPENIQVLLRQMRQTIQHAAPDAEETISYHMPAYRQNGVLVYFAAFKSHIGFFPTAAGVEAFKEKLSAYKTSKGAIRFPIDQPLPLELVEEIVRFRLQENLAKK